MSVIVTERGLFDLFPDKEKVTKMLKQAIKENKTLMCETYFYDLVIDDESKVVEPEEDFTFKIV